MSIDLFAGMFALLLWLSCVADLCFVAKLCICASPAAAPNCCAVAAACWGHAFLKQSGTQQLGAMHLPIAFPPLQRQAMATEQPITHTAAGFRGW